HRRFSKRRWHVHCRSLYKGQYRCENLVSAELGGGEMGVNKGSDGAVSTTVRPLHLLTTDILLADLISGRAISTNEGHSLAVATDHARSVLNWYRSNRRSEEHTSELQSREN